MLGPFHRLSIQLRKRTQTAVSVVIMDQERFLPGVLTIHEVLLHQQALQQAQRNTGQQDMNNSSQRLANPDEDYLFIASPAQTTTQGASSTTQAPTSIHGPSDEPFAFDSLAGPPIPPTDQRGAILTPEVATPHDNPFPPGIVSLDEWGCTMLTSGKHKFKTYADAIRADPSYETWILQHTTSTSSPWIKDFNNFIRVKNQVYGGPAVLQVSEHQIPNGGGFRLLRPPLK